MKKNKISSLIILVCITLFLLTSCSNYKIKETMNVDVQDFSHTDQNGNKITLAEFKGTPWLAMFIFTNCKTVCSPMTFNMTKIQEALEKEDVNNYKIVAFSVDPTVDTPEKLKSYIERFSVIDPSKWLLLTGYTQKYIEQFAKESFNSLVLNDPNSDQVVHMSQFYLVTPEGTVIKSYSGDNDVPIDTIVTDLKNLQ